MGSKCKPVDKQKIGGLSNVQGFTLLELIVVIAILGALAALAIPIFQGVIENARKTTDEANIRIVESAVALYQAEEGPLPASVTTFDELVTELNNHKYLQDSELKPVSKGIIFKYTVEPTTGTVKLSLVKVSAVTED